MDFANQQKPGYTGRDLVNDLLERRHTPEQVSKRLASRGINAVRYTTRRGDVAEGHLVVVRPVRLTLTHQDGRRLTADQVRCAGHAVKGGVPTKELPPVVFYADPERLNSLSNVTGTRRGMGLLPHMSGLLLAGTEDQAENFRVQHRGEPLAGAAKMHRVQVNALSGDWLDWDMSIRSQGEKVKRLAATSVYADHMQEHRELPDVSGKEFYTALLESVKKQDSVTPELGVRRILLDEDLAGVRFAAIGRFSKAVSHYDYMVMDANRLQITHSHELAVPASYEEASVKPNPYLPPIVLTGYYCVPHPVNRSASSREFNPDYEPGPYFFTTNKNNEAVMGDQSYEITLRNPRVVTGGRKGDPVDWMFNSEEEDLKAVVSVGNDAVVYVGRNGQLLIAAFDENQIRRSYSRQDVDSVATVDHYMPSPETDQAQGAELTI